MTVTGWIRTTERLPEPGTWVLGWFAYGDMSMEIVEFTDRHDDWRACWYRLWEHDDWVDAPPDFWMSLPAPPDREVSL